jgi:DNA-binding transcriptional ArsR family regulator
MMSEKRTICPCCGDELSLGRQIIAYLAELPPIGEDPADKRLMARTPGKIIEAVKGRTATVYKALNELEDDGLVERGVKYREPFSYHHNGMFTYRLTEEGKRIADSLASKGVSFCHPSH